LSVTEEKPEFVPTCPIPPTDYPNILIGHGGGGSLTKSLVDKILVPTFDNPFLKRLHDGAVLPIDGVNVAYTTDSYVVKPLFFPGGDIGQLAVYGTVNDLAMCGARPLFLSAGLVIEEGLPMDTLWRVVCSIRNAASRAQVQIVTGDTKVVDHGKGDGIFVNTSGIGLVEPGRTIAPDQVRDGDVAIINGDIGRHGMAIMAMREGLDFKSPIESDSQPLAGLTLRLLDAGLDIHCMRDLTRGGLAAASVEIAEAAGVQIDLDELKIPVCDAVRGACEILGLDPMHVANEGRFIAFIPESEAERAVALMRKDPCGAEAVAIGRVSSNNPGVVTMKTAIGGSVVVDMPSGENLPRIC
jgi:hydrogenase expression/formation protein HypE